MSDSYGDGWNGNTLEVAGQSLTLESGSEGTASVCIDMSFCNVITVGGGSWQSEVSWTLGELSGGAPYDGQIGDCGEVPGCMDDLALNYNPNATVDDGSCDYDIIIDFGACTDPNAINYDPNATFDDGSCEYETICNGLEASVNIFTDLYASEMSWELVDLDGASVATGSGFTSDNSTNVCLVEGSSYTMIMMDSYGDGWNGGSFTVVAACDLASGELSSGDYGTIDFVATCGDIDPCAAVDCDAGYECVDGDCILIDVEPWDVYITGTNHTIVIDGSAVIDLEDTSIEVGDVLGVFFTDDNGDLQCAGQTTWTGSNGAIAAQGDDSTTDELTGGKYLIHQVKHVIRGGKCQTKLGLVRDSIGRKGKPHSGSMVN